MSLQNPFQFFFLIKAANERNDKKKKNQVDPSSQAVLWQMKWEKRHLHR